MKSFHRLSTRLAMATLLPLVVLVLLATWLDNRSSRRTMLTMAESAAMDLSEGVKEELQGTLRSTRTGIEAFSLPLAHLRDPEEATVTGLLEEALNRIPVIFGSTLAYDPVPAGPEAPYVYRDDGGIVVTSLAGEDYRYWEWPWYTRPLQQDGPVWSAPYFDKGGGNVSMVTYSVPLAVEDRAAVLTADIRLGFLTELAATNLLGRQGAVFIFDDVGRLVSHPHRAWVLERDLSTLADSLHIPVLATLPAAVARDEEFWLRPGDGVHEGVVGGDPDVVGRMLVRPLQEAGWGIAVYFSDRDFLAPIQASTNKRLLFVLALLVLLTVILMVVTHHGLHPLEDLAKRTRDIAQGDFTAPTPDLERRDEIGRLARAFHQMQVQLEQFIEDLTQATAARERIEGELSAARQIQEQLVPNARPKLNDRGIELRALLRPVRAVGGDLYYYAMLDSKRLFFAIGDVSDKGVPAALFMARTNALLEAAARHRHAPGDILTAVNHSLCEDNAQCMFTTLLVGILDPENGRVELSSAGHDPALRLSHDGEPEWLTFDGGPPAGIDPDADFGTRLVDLAPGDVLLLYTDGATEALDSNGELFGNERLVSAVRGFMAGSAGEALERVVASVDAFTAGADPTDDLTVMAIRYAPTESGAQHEPLVRGAIDVTVTPGCHRTVIHAILLDAARTGHVATSSDDLRLVVEEILTNVVKHAGIDGDGSAARIEWSIAAAWMDLRFADPGVPFDPLSSAAAGMEGDDREDGGMGILLVRTVADEVRYRRRDGLNCLRLRFGDLDAASAAMESDA